MKIVIRLFLILIVLGLSAAGAAYWFYSQWSKTPVTIAPGEVISIEPGDNLSRLAYRLEEQGKLKHAKLLIFYAKMQGKTHLKVGEYRVDTVLTPGELLDLLQSDKVVEYSVTLVEGKTFKDFLKVLSEQPKLTKTLEGKSHQEILQLIGADVAHPEGWFYPDTYSFVAGSTDKDILLRAYQKMQTVLASEWEKRAENLPYKTPYEALIMASIIEKETGVAYERPEIAGVFVRRLQKGMRLQTDPTIIYGLGDEYKGNITRAHLKQYTPYNTYEIDGLPPTPIANPGGAAVAAALNPKPGKTLYFVAKGDGSHYFSETYSEHSRAVKKYQLNRQQNYRSSPGAN